MLLTYGSDAVCPFKILHSFGAWTSNSSSSSRINKINNKMNKNTLHTKDKKGHTEEPADCSECYNLSLIM